MRLAARYITSYFLKIFFISLFGLSTLFIFQEILGKITHSEYTVTQLLIYDMMNLPLITVRMIPPATLMATVILLSHFSRTSEMIAFFSLGIGLKQILMIILSVVFVISCASLVLQDRVLPHVYKKRVEYYWSVLKNKPDYFLDIKRNKVWYRSKNLIFNLRTFDPNQKKILGLSIYSLDEQFNLIEVIKAKSAYFSDEKWNLKNGTVTVFSGEDSVPITQKFEDKTLIIDETPADFEEVEKEISELRLKELFYYIERSKKAGIDTKSYEVKFHSRISLSFIPLIMALLAITFAFKMRREGGIAKDIGFCLLLTIFYWLFYSLGLSLGQKGVLLPWISAWLPSVLFATLGLVLLLRKRYKSS